MVVTLEAPHYGGIVERVIGTAMQQAHELPGTTFFNPGERGAYNADATAVLTLGELERWLTLAVASYDRAAAGQGAAGADDGLGHRSGY
jgi:putative transposase